MIGNYSADWQQLGKVEKLMTKMQQLWELTFEHLLPLCNVQLLQCVIIALKSLLLSSEHTAEALNPLRRQPKQF